MRKLRGKGVREHMLTFLRSYLQPRKAYVIVNGKQSERMDIGNMVFQGTVLGPPLWNVFFSDVSEAVAVDGFVHVKFADDLSIYKRYDKKVPNANVQEDLRLSAR